MQRSDANVSADFPLADRRTLLNIGHECALRVKFEFRISSQTRILTTPGYAYDMYDSFLI